MESISKLTEDAPREKVWFLYVVRRDDNALYTGITLDVQRRFKEHLSGRGAKALRGRSLVLSYRVALGDQSIALRAESRFKALSKVRKEVFIQQQLSPTMLLEALALG